MVTSRGLVLLAAQNSHIIRLLARGVQLDGVDKALDYRARMKARDRASQFMGGTGEVLDKAAKPLEMMSFDDLE